MSQKALRPKHLYVIHANNTLSRMPYFVDYPAFIRLLVKSRTRDMREEDYRNAVVFQAQKAYELERRIKLQDEARERDRAAAAAAKASRTGKAGPDEGEADAPKAGDAKAAASGKAATGEAAKGGDAKSGEAKATKKKT